MNIIVIFKRPDAENQSSNQFIASRKHTCNALTEHAYIGSSSSLIQCRRMVAKEQAYQLSAGRAAENMEWSKEERKRRREKKQKKS